MAIEPFIPVTREKAAEILDCSLTTLDAIVAAGACPHLGSLPRRFGASIGIPTYSTGSSASHRTEAFENHHLRPWRRLRPWRSQRRSRQLRCGPTLPKVRTPRANRRPRGEDVVRTSARVLPHGSPNSTNSFPFPAE